MLTVLKDVVGSLLLVFLLPLWMAVGLGAVAVVAFRQLYWWARGNTTVLSRPSSAGAGPSSRAEGFPDTSPAPAPFAPVLVASPALPGVSDR